METSEILQTMTGLIDSLGTVGILVYAWYQERKRADGLTSEIIADWKRQNDREHDNPVIVSS